ncbi:MULTISPECIES: hypothetical protein [Nitrosomonas]|nr:MULTISPECIES: hypothetical protein [Nitrosomonas]UVS62478.1 hypothetical protein NX761_04980 [Nitrosomonas sp. PLL12]
MSKPCNLDTSQIDERKPDGVGLRFELDEKQYLVLMFIESSYLLITVDDGSVYIGGTGFNAEGCRLYHHQTEIIQGFLGVRLERNGEVIGSIEFSTKEIILTLDETKKKISLNLNDDARTRIEGMFARAGGLH